VLNHFATVANYLLQCQSFCDFVSHSPDHVSHFFRMTTTGLTSRSRGARAGGGLCEGVRLRRSVMGVGTRALTGPNHVRGARKGRGRAMYICMCVYIYIFELVIIS
jgi:hypothetical protein